MKFCIGRLLIEDVAIVRMLSSGMPDVRGFGIPIP